MNFQNLQYFLTTAEEGNITRAAQRLHISQQALSNQIVRLEQELGCSLFSRKPNLELTYSGKCFQKAARQILDVERQAAAAIGDINQNRRGELRIGISHTRGQAILPLLLPDFHRAYPLAELSVLEGNTKELETDLEQGLIDVLIGFMPFLLESAETQILCKERLFLVAPKALMQSHFGDETARVLEAYRQNLDLSVFASIPFVLLKKGDRIRTLVDREFSRLQVAPDVCFETRNIQTAFALASEGMGLAVCPEMYLGSPYTISGLPEGYARQQVEILPFPSSGRSDMLAIGYNRERYLSQIAKNFIAMAVARLRTPHTAG